MSRKNVWMKFCDEVKLEEAERQKYLKELREYMRDRKLTNTTFGATFWGPKLYKPTIRIAQKVTEVFMEKDAPVFVEGQENIPEETVIFALNHQGILDNFIWLPYVGRHSLILHGAEVNKLLLAAQLNTGLIKVIKGDKENNRGAKEDMITLLMNHHSVVWFPEGTWNLSPNKYLLPTSYGLIDVARIAKVPIIPVAVECSYGWKDNKTAIEQAYVRFGEKIVVSDFDDLPMLLQTYRDRMSTMLYELQEKKGVFCRRTTDMDREYAGFLEMSYRNLKLGKLNRKKERKYIFQAQDDFYQFHNINEYAYDGDYCEKGLSPGVKYYRRSFF